MKKYDAQVVVRGRYLKSLLGDSKSSHITFFDRETAERFYSCQEYVALISLKDQTGKMSFNFYEE